MTIVNRTGDVFTSSAEALAHGVNLWGVMGAGIAKTMAERFPEMLPLYKAACRDGSLPPGGCQVLSTTSGVYVCNLATQVKPGSNARLKWVDMALLKMYNRLELRGLTSVAIPQIGCGIGGLEWSEVHPVIERHAQRFPHITTEIWTYSKEAL